MAVGRLGGSAEVGAAQSGAGGAFAALCLCVHLEEKT